MPTVRQTVATIHGVRTRGEWQDEVEMVLKPHFHCVSIRYPEYRPLGLTKVA